MTDGRRVLDGLNLDSVKGARLDAVLRAVTPEIALRLARAVETDRLQGGRLPHDAILEGLRPRLREAESRLQRMPTPQRLVCAAFEDLLVVRGDGVKQRGRIDRASIGPVWSWLTQELAPQDWTTAEEAIRSRLLNGGAEFTSEAVAAFQSSAAKVMLAAVPTGAADDERCAAAIKRLGGAAVAADAYDMARMLELGPTILHLQRRLARPISNLTDGDIGPIREVWESAQAGPPESPAYVIFFVLGRLARPWEIMHLAGTLSGKLDDIVISRTDVGAVGELLLADLEACGRRLSKLRPDQFEAAAALEPITVFSQTSTGVVRELGIRRDGPWGKRLMAARVAIAEETERLLERAVKTISITLPMSRRASLSLRARRMPDMSKPLDPAKAARAIETARFIAGARPHALAGAFAGLLSEVEEKIGEVLRHYTMEMIDELRDVAEPLRPQADSYVAHAIELTRLLFGAGEADLLRRRASAATALAPAKVA